MEQPQARRSMTAARVAAILAAAIIPTEGANKLSVVGRGNPFTREDGTQVRIFNVQAFASHADAQEAAKSFQEGLKLEKSGDVTGAQVHFKAALNKMMSFSVLERNAEAFEGTYQIIGKVEWVEGQNGKRLGINNPRPVAVEASGSSVANLFELPVEAAQQTPEGAELSEEAKAALANAGTGSGTGERKPLGAIPKGTQPQG